MKMKTLNRNLYLIGFMGSGKTSVSKLLCSQVNGAWVDMDEKIVEKEGCAITEIFAKKGEAYFREIETAVLEDIATTQGQVVSCGGGVILKDENIRIMRESGTVIYLSATPETIFQHVRFSNKRPVLNGNMNVEYISSLLEERKKYYEKAQDLTIITDGCQTQVVVNKIKKLIFL